MSFLSSQLHRYFTGQQVVTRSKRRRKTASADGRQSSEVLESRTLLTQIITATANKVAPVVGDSIEVAVNYNFTGADRVQSQGLNVQMHFNQNELQFTGFKVGTFEIDGKVEPADITAPVLSDDTAVGENKDNDPATDKFIKSVWNVALGNWPGTVDPGTGNRLPAALPSELFVATFTVKAGFDGESINFTGTPQGGQTFQGTSVLLAAPGGPTQSVAPVATPASVAVGDVFEVAVPYDIANLQRVSSQGLNVQMHFNSQELEFVAFKTGTYEIDGKVEPADITAPVLNDDTAGGENKDNDPATDKFIKSVWNVALGNWPGTVDPGTGNRLPKNLPSNLYVAQFRAKAGFNGETINFSGTPQGGASFTSVPVNIAAAALPTVTLGVSPASISENGGIATFTATLSAAAPAGGVTVTLGFTGTATDVTDYTKSGTTITIPAGATTGTATVTAVSDAVADSGETVIVDITAVTGATETGTQQATTTITETAPPTVTLGVSPASISENGGVATFTATLSAPAPAGGVTVTLGFTGTATDVTDYTKSGTTITIPAGATTGTATVTAVSDAVADPGETVIVDITAVTGATETGTQQATTTITEAPLAFDFDIDGNGQRNPFQDAVLVFAWMSAGTPDSVFQQFIDPNGTRNTPAAVKQYLDSNTALFDVDLNGTTNPFQDAVLVFGWMSQGTSDTVLQTFIANNANTSRDTAVEVRAYLDALQNNSLVVTQTSAFSNSSSEASNTSSELQADAPALFESASDSDPAVIFSEPDDELDSVFATNNDESSIWRSLFGA